VNQASQAPLQRNDGRVCTMRLICHIAITTLSIRFPAVVLSTGNTNSRRPLRRAPQTRTTTRPRSQPVNLIPMRAGPVHLASQWSCAMCLCKHDRHTGAGSVRGSQRLLPSANQEDETARSQQIESVAHMVAASPKISQQSLVCPKPNAT